jgi:hypothetical protein
MELGDTPIADLSPLLGLTSLRRLDVRGARQADLAPLAKLPNCHLVSTATFRRSRR